MAASQVVAFSTNAIADNQTRQLGAVSTSNNVGTLQQEYVQTPCREAGVADRAYCTISANTVTADSFYRFRVNSSNGNMGITIGALQTGEFEDTTNTDTLDADDYFNWQLSVTNTTPASEITIKTLSFRFTPTNTAKTISWVFGGGSGQNFDDANTTRYTSPSGSIKDIVSESDCQIRIPASFVARNLATMVATNSRTTDTTVKNRINGADGSQSIVIGSGQTGWFEDASHTDNLSAGDDYAYSITTLAGTQVINIRSISNTLESSESKFLFAAGAPDGMVRASNGTDAFFAMAANISQATSVEADAQIRPAFAFTISDLNARANANTTNQQQAVSVRLNGSSVLTAAIPAGNTGLFSDSGPVDVDPGDTLSLMLDLAGTGSGNISLHQVTVLASHGGGGGGRTTRNTRSHPLGRSLGINFRMPLLQGRAV